AHVADVAELKRAFQAGHDIHALTASEVFGVPLDRMDPPTRRRAKAINFTIIYGISAFGLGNEIGVPQGEAAEYIRAYFERFPGIRAYMEKIKGDARRTGYVETIFGRKCWISGIRDANPARRGGAERQAINAPLQGSAADIIKRAMGRLPAASASAASHAQQNPSTRVPRVGLLSHERSRTRLLQGLRDVGYDDGRNLIIEYRPVDRPELLARFAAELVALDVDVIVASGSQA